MGYSGASSEPSRLITLSRSWRLASRSLTRFPQQRKKPPEIVAIEPRAFEDDKVHTETHAVVPVEADPHWGFRFFDSSQVARAPDLEDPTSGVLEQLSFVESQEELPIVHLSPADSIQGISRETSAWSLSGPSSAQHLRPARLWGLIFAIMGSASSLFQALECTENDYESVKEALVDMSEDTSAHVDIGSDSSFSLKKPNTLSHRKATAALATAGHCPLGAVHLRFCVTTRWAEHHGKRRCDSEDAHRAAQAGSTATPCTIRTNILWSSKSSRRRPRDCSERSLISSKSVANIEMNTSSP